MKAGFFQDGAGDNSMGRLLAFIAVLIGAVTIAGGMIAFYLGPSPEALAIITLGVGLCGGSEWMKNVGKKLENGSGS